MSSDFTLFFLNCDSRLKLRRTYQLKLRLIEIRQIDKKYLIQEMIVLILAVHAKINYL